ncbi:MAG: polysaccharide biosynthesis/export family protein [Acidobacteria bacterium]|nr:polysaccharide biosynthesis/export family protein [Acidobacteriota bacterium]
MSKILAMPLWMVLGGVVACAQQAAPPEAAPASAAVQKMVEQVNAATAELRVSPGDEVDIGVYGAPELAVHTRVNSDGTVAVPLLGNVAVAGLTASQAQAAIATRLTAANLFSNPQVSFFVKEYTGEGISVGGEVGHPGLYPALGPHRLLDIIQLAGGTTITAGRKIVIAHRGHMQDAQTIMLSSDPLLMAQDNVELQPGDTVIVSKASLVYVLGEVGQPGAYTMDESDPATVLKAIALAKGPTTNAALKRVTVLHRSSGGLTESTVPLGEILHARAGDVALNPEDIVMVAGKRHIALNSGMVVQTLTNLAIYRGF